MSKRDVGFFPIRKGYITLPFINESDARSKFIARCNRKKRVTVLFDNGGFANDCPISIESLNQIEFPEKFGQVGSTVLCWIEPDTGKPFIISVYGRDQDIFERTEFQKKLNSSTQNSKSEVTVDGKKGEVFINVDSSEDDGGNVFINISNKSRKGKLNIKVFGTSDIYSDSDCNINSSGVIVVSVNDPSTGKVSSKLTIDKENITIDPKTKFNVFKGSSPISLGDKLVTQLNKNTARVDGIISAIENGVPGTGAADGGAALQTTIITGLQALVDKENYSSVNSEKSFTD